VTKTLRVSVRGLVAHSLRTGDLLLESWGSTSTVDAIRAHQKVQRSRGDSYRAEVTVEKTIHKGDLTLEVHGRIDGVQDGGVEDGADTVIEEIKTTHRDLHEQVLDENALHWGQLRVYAHIYAEQNCLDAVTLRLTYFQLDTGATKEIDRRVETAELLPFFDDLVDRYLRWARRVEAWTRRRDASAQACAFPFESYRPGQREMAVAAYRALRTDRHLLVEAPTGIGKTQAVLFPAVKALGEGATDTLVYLTARTTGRGLAEEGLDRLRAAGLHLKSLTMTAKEKICFNPEKACTAEECTYARGFYDRLGEAMEEIDSTDAFTRKTVEAIAERHHICPYELSMELTPWMDAVIGDFNHAFDPRAHLRPLFEEDRKRTSLLVDEAHNLPDRAREMFSAELRKAAFDDFRRSLVREGELQLRPALEALKRWFLDVRKRLPRSRPALAEERAPGELEEILSSFLQIGVRLLAESSLEGLTSTSRARLKERLFEAMAFTRTLLSFDETFVTCYEARGRDVRVKLLCTDPGPKLKERFGRSHGSVLFSATLPPFTETREMLGLAADTHCVRLPTPFPPENLLVMVADRVSTKYRDRESSRESIGELLSSFVKHRRGNYLLFFPSYEYLALIRGSFDADGTDVIEQRPEMTESERAHFLSRFSSEGDRTVVGFAVLGGFFGEAIDLRGERLSGVGIVGVGLPGLSSERDEIQRRLDARAEYAGLGYELAYVRPGMQRVRQAAGRLIRSETDRGALLLVDERYRQARYRRLAPPEWSPVSVSVRGVYDLKHALDRFWLAGVAMR
jgi:DNA excision repair protein ERCC-2